MNDLFAAPAPQRELYFEVPGEVRGKGRPRFTLIKKKDGSSFVSTYTDKNTKSYEARIAQCAALAKAAAHWQIVPISDPDDVNPIVLRMDVIAEIHIPVSRPKRVRAALDGKPALSRIDGDNILKIIQDSLHNILYMDDKCIAVSTVTKRWTASAANERLQVRITTC